MEKEMSSLTKVEKILCGGSNFLRKCIFRVLKVGPIPNHIAFIMDGNRRYAKKKKPSHDGGATSGHDAGFWALMSMLLYCYELGVKYITAYAFSIDNFKRKPEEVQSLTETMLKKADLLKINVERLSIRVCFAGNLGLMSDEVRVLAMELMEITAGNSNLVLTICVAYTSRDEILHAVKESCEEKRIDHDPDADAAAADSTIKLMDLEKNMYMVAGPNPDIIIRTGGENRLSNFLLWQSCCSRLYTMLVLWPEIGLWDLVFAVMDFQKNKPYFEMMKKKEIEM